MGVRPGQDPVLQINNIHVAFGQAPALKGVDFDLYPGEVHALVGEHRSGKSTLCKLLSGEVRKQSGTILLHGAGYEFFTPKLAIQKKIGFVHQHLQVIPSLNAVENIYAGRMPQVWSKKRYYAKIYRECRRLLAGLGVEINLNVAVGSLTLAEQQMVEFARMISMDPDIMILDEISSRLTPAELEKVNNILKELKARGKGVIYVSPNLDEVFRFADRVTVLKNGVRRSTELVKNLDYYKLARLAYSFFLNLDQDEKATRELLMIKQYSNTFLQDLPIGIITLDKHHRVFNLSQAACQLLDLQEDSFIGSAWVEFSQAHGISNPQEMVEHLKTGERFLVNGLTVHNEKKVNIKGYPLRDEEGFFMGTVIMVEDVSMDYFVKEYLLRAEKIESIAELAAGVAHEINNPLGIVQNYLDVVKIREQDPELKQRLVKIEKEIIRISEIVESLLSFSRVKQAPDRKIDLIELLEEVILLLSHKLKEKQINFHKDFEARQIWIQAHENKLKQVFINLTMNSIEAVLNQGCITLGVRDEPRDGYVEVIVRDNGYGIPLDIQEDIFNPFYSTKITKKNVGLGLTICQHIVEGHRGVITFTSTPGEETCFRVKLPH